MNYFDGLDLPLLSKIVSYVPMDSIGIFKLVCKIFDTAVLEYYKELCSEIVSSAPNCPTPIQNHEVLDCMYRLYDIHFHGIITDYMYDAYKTQLGLSDIYLLHFYGDRFVAYPRDIPRYQSPRSAVYCYVKTEEGKLKYTQIFPFSLCNFSAVQRVYPQSFDENEVLIGLRNISQKLQCKLVKEMPECTFDIVSLILHRISLPVMMSFGEKIIRIDPIPTPFESDHMYLRSLIPLFYRYRDDEFAPRWKLRLFFLMVKSLPCPPFGRPYNLDPETCTSIAMAIYELGDQNYYKEHFLREDRYKIKAKIEELEREYNSKLINAKKRDASPKRE